MSFGDALESVTIVRPPGKDDYGDPIPGPATEFPIDGCLVAPLRSTEPIDRDRTNVAVTGWSVFAPPGSPEVLHTDQVRLRGVLCDLLGEPALWAGEYGGLVLNVTRAT